MKTIGIIMLVIAVVILLIGVISPVNIFLSVFLAALFFVLGAIIIKRH
jgi:flagellar biosynthesis component FlhA